LKNLKKYQEILENEIQDNQDAVEVWGLFSNLIDKIEKIDDKQIERNN
jgi:hypothetical protein